RAELLRDFGPTSWVGTRSGAVTVDDQLRHLLARERVRTLNQVLRTLPPPLARAIMAFARFHLSTTDADVPLTETQLRYIRRVRELLLQRFPEWSDLMRRKRKLDRD